MENTMGNRVRLKVKQLVNVVQKVIFSPFLLFSIIQFSVRKILFGFDNACNYLRCIDSRCIKSILYLYKAKIGKNCDIQSGIVFHNCKNFKNFKLGKNVHIGKDCFFDLRGEINIGNNVVISMRSIFITHIDMTHSKLSHIYPANSSPILVQNDSYLGVNSTILMGVVIGKGAIIGANSLVNKCVHNSEFVAGIPAKKISTNGNI